MIQDRPVMPWWRVRTMWLVVAGPALVVVAGTATMVIAVRGADTPLRTAPSAEQPTTLSPAMKARNHAATARP